MRYRYCCAIAGGMRCRFCKLLPGGNPQEDRLLQLLDAVYLMARYCPQPFFIAEHEPDLLQSRAREMMAAAREYMHMFHL